jgi:hypothetical protein
MSHIPEELIEQLKQLGVILLTKWQTWRDEGREEYKFHCDLLLAPGAFVTLEAGTCLGEQHWLIIQDANKIRDASKWTKVHIALSWEHRDKPFEN